MTVFKNLHIIIYASEVPVIQFITDQLETGSGNNRISTATNIEEAKLIHLANPVDALLFNVSQQQNSGYKELLKCIQSLHETAILVTQKKENTIISAQAIRAGAQDYITHADLTPRHLHRQILHAVERKKINQESDQNISKLETLNRTYAQLFEMNGLAHWEFDIVTKQIKINSVFRQQFDLKSGDYLSLNDLLGEIDNADRKKVQNFFEALSTSNEKHNCEFRIPTKKGQFKIINIQAQHQMDYQTGKIRILGTTQEIHLDDSYSRLQSEAAHRKTIKEIRDKIIDKMGRNIRTPLYSLYSFLYLLEGKPIQKQNLEAFAGIKASLNELQHYLTQMMNVGIIANNEGHLDNRPFELLRELQLNHLMSDNLQEENNISFHLKMGQNIPYKAIGDPTLIFQILNNAKEIFKNISSEKRKVNIYITTETTSGNWFNLKLHLRDSLPCPEKFKALGQQDINLNLDEPTNNGDNDHYDKARINLLVLHKLAKATKGSCTSGLTPKGAIEFFLAIPLKQVADSLINPPTQHWIESIKVLIVEDHFLNQIATKNVVQSWSEHIQVDIAENGQVAVEKHATSPYDIILMDLQMPVMNGIEASKTIRLTSQVPIIAMSANTSDTEEDYCKSIGINSYLAKPFQPELLKTKVFELVSVF
jgi:CheY-like chemotaxis protein